jgi:ribosomal protein S18 acetylase RimI-like enzyme
MSILVRRASVRDYAMCAAIFARGWAHAFPHLPREITRATFDEETEDEMILVAEDNRALLGWAGFYRADNFLHHLYVDPPFHGRGVGRALVGAVRDAAMAPISLKCSLSNTSAQAFYARLGFTEGERGEDAYGQWVRLIAPNA